MSARKARRGLAATTVAALAAVVAVVAAGCDDSAAAPPAPAAPRVADPSGLVTTVRTAADGVRVADLINRPRVAGAWPSEAGASGVNGDPLIDKASVENFCRWRGRRCAIAHAFTDRRGWAPMTTGSGWMFQAFAGFEGALVISQGLVPEGRADDLDDCAAGQFDHLWHGFGKLMVDHRRASSVVRLGWEFNGAFMPWHGGDPATWTACYRRAAGQIRAANPEVVLDWTINAHTTPPNICGGVSTGCYPGDEWVDIIGIDNYDHYPSSADRAEFDRVAQAPEGLSWLYRFAVRRGKLFSVGEWGIAPGSAGNPSRENPQFVDWMHQWFAAHSDRLAYEAYFHSCHAGGIQSTLIGPASAGCRQNPNAAARYRTLFGR
ncbi:glycosyl hydrolase [Pilimelia columellifera]|uniref:GH26 domain-containing protein n=1 Tax=Pilimelia columellifera subsp. columellifera TaxID=706583 RepID=A0ABN3N4L0_9ACTN